MQYINKTLKHIKIYIHYFSNNKYKEESKIATASGLGITFPFFIIFINIINFSNYNQNIPILILGTLVYFIIYGFVTIKKFDYLMLNIWKIDIKKEVEKY